MAVSKVPTALLLLLLLAACLARPALADKPE